MKLRPAHTAAGLLACVPISASSRPAPIDGDGDGIPASWESTHGTSDANPADARMDPDGDGLNNLAEFLTGGRPWGRYAVHRCPLPLPDTDPSATVEFIAGNRAGEFLLNVTAAGRTDSFLWTIKTADSGTSRQPELMQLPWSLPLDVPFNDAGQILLDGSILSVRDWNAPPVQVKTAPGESAAGLMNDGRVLIVSTTRETIRGRTGGWQNYQFRSPEDAIPGDILTFPQPVKGVAATLPVFDPAGEAWITGRVIDSGPRLQRGPSVTAAWSLRAWGEPDSLPTPPKTWTGTRLHAMAAGRAAGSASGPRGAELAVILDSGGWQSLRMTGNPWILAISDSGLATGWDFAVSPPAPFVWNGIPAPLGIAIPEVPPSFVASGLTRSGTLFGIDHTANSPAPVALRPTPSSLHDDSPPARMPADSDRDGDGILDDREIATGLRPDRMDSDGDGWSDLHEIIHSRSRQAASNAALPPDQAGDPSGLAVFSPTVHPLLATRINKRPVR